MSVEDPRLAVIGLGSNLGDSVTLIEEAIESVSRFGVQPIFRSSLWKSAPVHCPPGAPDFINAIIAIHPSLTETPESLLGKLQALEGRLGRVPKRTLNESRPIDLDLVAYGEVTRDTEYLVLPHPRAHRRKFVLAPLSEILPHFCAPGWEADASILLNQLTADESNTEICERL